jgi:hypothetical protein
MSDIIATAYLRLSQLLLAMMDASQEKKKEEFLMLMQSFEDDYSTFIDLLADKTGLSDEDIEKIIPPQAEGEVLSQVASSQSGYRLPVIFSQILSKDQPPVSEASPKDGSTSA